MQPTKTEPGRKKKKQKTNNRQITRKVIESVV